MIKSLTTTGIGSLPFTDAQEAVRFSLSACDIPFWPQLPARSFLESMIPQYAEGFPGIVFDETREKVYVRDDPEGLNAFYEALSEDREFPLSEKVAPGCAEFIRATEGCSHDALKGQITGPMTFSLGLKMEDGRSVFASEELREVSLLLLKKKAEWQIKELSGHAGSVIIFIDEPILSAIGSSSYLGVSEDETLRMLTEIVSFIKEAGGIPGIHCCGRADWGLLMRTGTMILNFDAFDFYDSFRLYPEDLKGYLQRGGYIASGIVPTTDAINETSPDELRDRMLFQMDDLSRLTGGMDVAGHLILTPSCGAGGRSREEAEKVFSYLRRLKESLL